MFITSKLKKSVNPLKGAFTVLLTYALVAFVMGACTAETADLHSIHRPEGEVALPSLQIPDTIDVTVEDPFTVRVEPFVGIKEATVSSHTQSIVLTDQEHRAKLDLIFVIDDTNSMEPHHENLAANVGPFSEELSRLSLLDYRVAVVSSYDSKRYFNVVSEYSRLSPGVKNFRRLGTFAPVAGSSNGTPFVTPEMGHEVLSETLKLGAKEHIAEDTYGAPDDGNGSLGPLLVEAFGPEFEELLGPLLMATSPQSLLLGANALSFQQYFPGALEEHNSWAEFASQFNKGFVRHDADLGVVIVSDSIDESPFIDADFAAKVLSDLKGDRNFDRISTYGVLHKNTLSFGLQSRLQNEFQGDSDCPVDPANRGARGHSEPKALESFFDKTRGHREQGSNIFNICSASYGEKLTKIAKDLFKRAVENGSYDLDRIPTAEIQLYYTETPDQKIPHCSHIEEASKLCWATRFGKGERKIILNNQHLVDDVHITIQYPAIDPASASVENSQPAGN